MYNSVCGNIYIRLCSWLEQADCEGRFGPVEARPKNIKLGRFIQNYTIQEGTSYNHLPTVLL